MNQIQQRFNLTDEEMKAVQHRLDAETMVDVFEEREWPREEVAYINQQLMFGELAIAEERNAEITEEIIVDCIEGSTWAAVRLDGTPLGERAWRKARSVLVTAAAKIGAAYGRTVSVPRG